MATRAPAAGGTTRYLAWPHHAANCLVRARSYPRRTRKRQQSRQCSSLTSLNRTTGIVHPKICPTEVIPLPAIGGTFSLRQLVAMQSLSQRHRLSFGEVPCDLTLAVETREGVLTRLDQGR